MSIGATEFGKARVVDRFDPVLGRWFTRSSWFTFLICRPYGHQSCNQAQASQRLNHVVECIRNVPKEFGDISPDYQVGRTTVCFSSGFSVLPIRPTAGRVLLGRSLRYHRLHPEYIHQRIERLGQAYNLRVLLPMRDIVRRTCLILTHPAHPLAPQSEHQDPIRELTKICLLNIERLEIDFGDGCVSSGGYRINITVIVAWS